MGKPVTNSGRVVGAGIHEWGGYERPYIDKRTKKEKTEDAIYKIDWWEYQLRLAKCADYYKNNEKEERIQHCKLRLKTWHEELQALKEG